MHACVFVVVRILFAQRFAFVIHVQDKYIISGKQLVVKQLPQHKIHPRMWKGSDKKFQAFPMREQHAMRVNKVRSLLSYLVFHVSCSPISILHIDEGNECAKTKQLSPWKGRIKKAAETF
jgi:hypothetical protein